MEWNNASLFYKLIKRDFRPINDAALINSHIPNISQKYHDAKFQLKLIKIKSS